STTAMNTALALMAKAFKLNYSSPTNNNQRISSNPRNRQIAQPGMNMGQDRQMQMVRGNGGNQFRQYAGQNAGNLNGPRRTDAAYLQTQLLIAQKEEARIQLQAEEYDLTTFLKAATSVVSRQDATNFYQSWMIILAMGFLLKTATSVVSRKEAVNFY
nr:hypothetical protein [Tanacetum cinerariifolium]